MNEKYIDVEQWFGKNFLELKEWCENLDLIKNYHYYEYAYYDIDHEKINFVYFDSEISDTIHIYIYFDDNFEFKYPKPKDCYIENYLSVVKAEIRTNKINKILSEVK